MRFAPVDARIDCHDLVRGPDSRRAKAPDHVAEQAVEVLHRLGFVAFRIGQLRLPVEESRKIAQLIAERLCHALVDRGAPASMRLEVDRAQETYVPFGYQTRTLLPHFDGQHCSYLTPSLNDVPEWDVRWREFGAAGYTTTPAHKMYQGIFLSHSGEGLSVTTYYDWVGVLGAVREARGIGTADEPVAAVARWLGRNLLDALARQPDHGCPYPSFGAMLGLAEPVWHGLSFHHAEAPLSAEARARHPEAVPLTRGCPCGRCEGDTARIFCHQVLMATGLNWREFRDRWEVRVPGDHCDLLFGHNLTMLHGGLAGGPDRVLEPLCLVIDEPSGPAYERWLAASWRRTLPVTPQPRAN